jgi:hypothetical protein
MTLIDFDTDEVGDHDEAEDAEVCVVWVGSAFDDESTCGKRLLDR